MRLGSVIAVAVAAALIRSMACEPPAGKKKKKWVQLQTIQSPPGWEEGGWASLLKRERKMALLCL